VAPVSGARLSMARGRVEIYIVLILRGIRSLQAHQFNDENYSVTLIFEVGNARHRLK